MQTKNGEAAIVEWAPFRLANGASESALLAASDAIQRDFLEKQPGFVHRELLRTSDGKWADFLIWRDDAAATAAMNAVASSPACHAYFELMQGLDGGDVVNDLLHFQRIRVYDRVTGRPT